VTPWLTLADGNGFSPEQMQMVGLLVVMILVIAGIGVGVIVVLRKKPKLGGLEAPAFQPLGVNPVPRASDHGDALDAHRHYVAIENRARWEACRLAQHATAETGMLWMLAGNDPLGAVAMAMARHLDALGLPVAVQLLDYPDRLGPDAARERKSLTACKIKIVEMPMPRSFEGAGAVVLGADPTFLSEARRSGMEGMLNFARDAKAEVVLLDPFTLEYQPPVPAAEDMVIAVPEWAQGPITREDVRLLDSLAIANYFLPGASLMENAGFWAAREAYFLCQDLGGEAGAKSVAVTVVCGKGNNGGDGLVVARHLFGWGLQPRVFVLGFKDKLLDEPARNLSMLQQLGLKVEFVADDMQWPALEAALNETSLIVDAILGTGMSGPVRGVPLKAIEMINAAREHGASVFAVDTPSGLDCNTGEPLGACVKADLTVTFAALKLGFVTGKGPEYCGRIVLADIGLPRDVYKRRSNAGLPPLADAGTVAPDNPTTAGPAEASAP